MFIWKKEDCQAVKTDIFCRLCDVVWKMHLIYKKHEKQESRLVGVMGRKSVDVKSGGPLMGGLYRLIIDRWENYSC